MPPARFLRADAPRNGGNWRWRAAQVRGQFSLLDSPKREKTIEGRFTISPDFFSGIDPARDPNAIREVFHHTGIPLSATDSVEYFRDRSLLRAKTSRENLELIDAYASSHTPVTRQLAGIISPSGGIRQRSSYALLPLPLPCPLLRPQSRLHRIPSVLQAPAKLALHQIPSGIDHRLPT